MSPSFAPHWHTTPFYFIIAHNAAHTLSTTLIAIREGKQAYPDINYQFPFAQWQVLRLDLTGELIFYLYFCLCNQRVWHLRQARQKRLYTGFKQNTCTSHCRMAPNASATLRPLRARYQHRYAMGFPSVKIFLLWENPLMIEIRIKYLTDRIIKLNTVKMRSLRLWTKVDPTWQSLYKIPLKIKSA